MTTENDNKHPAESLLRAQAAELEALRSMVTGLPDAETLASWRASHERLSALQADLPSWRASLQAAHESERSQLQERLQQQQQALTEASLASDLQQAFAAAGGSAPHFAAWRTMAGQNVARAEDGSITINGKPVSDALNEHRSDAVYSVFFHPRYGSGGGSRGGFDGRVVNGPDLHKMSTSELFRVAFNPKGNQQ